MPPSGTSVHRAPGRPRDDQIDESIFDAVRSVLAADGYGHLTIDRIAHVAGVSKATIYRRWNDKAEIVGELLARQHFDMITFPDTGSVRDDLLGWLRSMVAALTDPRGEMVTAVMSQFPHEPKLAAAFRERFSPPYDEQYRCIITRGVARGELVDGTDAALAANLLVGALYHRFVLYGLPLDDDVAEQYVDLFLEGATPR